jgi:predicted TIM-barrel fold metal-dependent hydrolase
MNGSPEPSHPVGLSDVDAGARESIVDWHSHVWLPEHIGEWARYMPHTPSEAGHDSHRQAMADGSVEEFLVLALDFQQIGVHVPNEYVADYLAGFGSRGIGVASVDPADPSAVDKLTYAATELGMRGLKLSPPYQGFHPHSDAAWEIYRKASDLGLFMIFHQGWVFDPRCSLEEANPILLDRVARGFPDMKIIIAHLGQPWITETVGIMRRHKNVFTDISARFSRPRQLYDGLVTAIEHGVIDRVLFGSDFPVISPFEAQKVLMDLESLLPGMPPISEGILTDLIRRRPLSLLDPDAPISAPETECC